MSWKELYNEQKKLDLYIHKNQNFKYDETFQKRTLAFLVELSELANELRHFKFWSSKPPSPNEVVLEEFADGIHFLLSIGISLNKEYSPKKIKIQNWNKNQFVLHILKIYKLACEDLSRNNNYEELFDSFFQLGINLHFEEKTIFEHYYQKNKQNYKRQQTNY